MKIYQIFRNDGTFLDAVASENEAETIQNAIDTYGEDISIYEDEEFNNGGYEDDESDVTISVEEYESLMDASLWMQCLEMAGVDNWSGYELAAKYYQNGGVE